MKRNNGALFDKSTEGLLCNILGVDAIPRSFVRRLDAPRRLLDARALRGRASRSRRFFRYSLMDGVGAVGAVG